MTLAVALCTDLMMEAPLHAAVCSLIGHASVELDFYFMLNGFDTKRRDLLRRSMDMSGKAYKATFVEEPSAVDLANLKPFHGNRTPYYRLFLPELVPADRLLYLDSDIVSAIDVAPLIELGMSYASGFVPAGVTGTYIERELFARVGLPPDTPAFNSGVMLFDLKVWRDQKLGLETLDFCRKHQEYDQTGLIAVSAGRFDALHAKYNMPLYTSDGVGIRSRVSWPVPFRRQPQALGHRRAPISLLFPHLRRGAGEDDLAAARDGLHEHGELEARLQNQRRLCAQAAFRSAQVSALVLPGRCPGTTGLSFIT